MDSHELISKWFFLLVKYNSSHETFILDEEGIKQELQEKSIFFEILLSFKFF